MAFLPQAFADHTSSPQQGNALFKVTEHGFQCSGGRGQCSPFCSPALLRTRSRHCLFLARGRSKLLQDRPFKWQQGAAVVHLQKCCETFLRECEESLRMHNDPKGQAVPMRPKNFLTFLGLPFFPSVTRHQSSTGTSLASGKSILTQCLGGGIV